MPPRPERYELRIDDAALDDLQHRLGPDAPARPGAGQPWAFGTDLVYMRGLLAHWRDGFDWRAAEARLNAFAHYRIALAGIGLHYLHVPGVGPDPAPLLLCHGWPGSVFEFLDIIPRLTDPGRFGGDPADAFTIVAPSLPGFGLSFAPGQARFSAEAIADCLATLMTDCLGYPTFCAQGGDWGAFICARLGFAHPERLTGIHLNFLPLRRDAGLVADPDPAERRYVEELSAFLREEAGIRRSRARGPRPSPTA